MKKTLAVAFLVSFCAVSARAAAVMCQDGTKRVVPAFQPLTQCPGGAPLDGFSQALVGPPLTGWLDKTNGDLATCVCKDDGSANFVALCQGARNYLYWLNHRGNAPSQPSCLARSGTGLTDDEIKTVMAGLAGTFRAAMMK